MHGPPFSTPTTRTSGTSWRQGLPQGGLDPLTHRWAVRPPHAPRPMPAPMAVVQPPLPPLPTPHPVRHATGKILQSDDVMHPRRLKQERRRRRHRRRRRLRQLGQSSKRRRRRHPRRQLGQSSDLFRRLAHLLRPAMFV